MMKMHNNHQYRSASLTRTKNLVLITSVINTISYTGKIQAIPIDENAGAPLHPMSRSAFTHEERFEQTKKTIASVRTKIPNCIIFLVECSELRADYHDYLAKATDYFFNLWDTELRSRIFTPSKALGEGTQTIFALEYIFGRGNIAFDNFFKISGRYCLDERFTYANWNNPFLVIREFPPSKSVFTFLYKMSPTHARDWLEFLKGQDENFRRCVGYETIYAHFVEKWARETVFIDVMGVQGYFSPDGSRLCI
jgi:hypothetical protein